MSFTSPRRPKRSLTADQKVELVRMRTKEDATWQKIGRAFNMQETRAKQIFERVVAQGAVLEQPAN